MPPKKSSKSSKLARMNEQERVRYLERKLAEEEESKRRKEDMVHTFHKLKLKKEERFFVINNSKVIQEWRNILRTAKISDLKANIKLLMDSFGRAINKKSAQVRLLVQDLSESENQYNLGFRSLLEVLQRLEENHRRRLEGLLWRHECTLSRALHRRTIESEQHKRGQNDAQNYLEDVLIAANQRNTSLMEQTNSIQQQLKDDTRNKNMEEKQAVQFILEETLEGLWFHLQRGIKQHKTATEEKRRIYGDLLSKDKKGVAEVLENNKKISKLLDETHRLKDLMGETSAHEERKVLSLREEKEKIASKLHQQRNEFSGKNSKSSQNGLQKLARGIDQVEKTRDQVRQFQKHLLLVAQNVLSIEAFSGHQRGMVNIDSDIKTSHAEALLRCQAKSQEERRLKRKVVLLQSTLQHLLKEVNLADKELPR